MTQTLETINFRRRMELSKEGIPQKFTVVSGPFLSIIDAQSLSGETVLYVAVQKNRKGVVEALIDKGANPNLLPNHGYTLLMSAISNGHEKVALLLLEKLPEQIDGKWGRGKEIVYFAVEMEMDIFKMIQEKVSRCFRL